MIEFQRVRFFLMLLQFDELSCAGLLFFDAMTANDVRLPLSPPKPLLSSFLQITQPANEIMIVNV